MARPPFRYKPTSGRSAMPAKESIEQVELLGSADILAAYSDVFVVGNEEGTGMASLYFYQRLLADRGTSLGITEAGLRASKAKCISRIVMAPEAVEKLLEALATNRGFTLTRKTDVREEKK